MLYPSIGIYSHGHGLAILPLSHSPDMPVQPLNLTGIHFKGKWDLEALVWYISRPSRPIGLMIPDSACKCSTNDFRFRYGNLTPA